MAWPESSLPLDSCGESPVLDVPELVLDVPLLVLELLEPALDVLDAALDCACAAAAAAANVPARPATTNPAVIAVVRRSPVSRSMDRLRSPMLLAFEIARRPSRRPVPTLSRCCERASNCEEYRLDHEAISVSD